MPEFFSDLFFCLAPCQRGYGKSHALERVESYKIGLLVQDLKAIIDHFGGLVMVLGYNCGGCCRLCGGHRLS